MVLFHSEVERVEIDERSEEMSKRKYRKGQLVKSLDELFQHDWFIVDVGKTYHCGWVRSLQLQTVYYYVKNGLIFFAELIEGVGNEKQA